MATTLHYPIKRSKKAGYPVTRAAWMQYYVELHNKKGTETSAQMAMFYQLLILAELPSLICHEPALAEASLGTNRNWPGSNYD